MTMNPTATDSPRTLLRGAGLVSMDPQVGDLARADILIEGDRIVAVGAQLSDDVIAGADVVDFRGRVVLPGLVDSHRHTWETALRGTGADLSLGGYIGWILMSQGPATSSEEIGASTRLGALEALDAGITTLLDWCNASTTPAHADAAVEALASSGIRAVFAHGRPTDAEDVRRLARALAGEPLVSLALALGGPEFGPLEATVEQIGLARDLGLVASMHVGCGTFGPRAGSITRLAEAGLLGPDVNLVHANTSSDAEIALIAETGASLTVTPFVEMLMGHGTPAVGRALLAEATVGLGIDVALSAGPDLFSQMRAALASARTSSNQALLDAGEDPREPTPRARELLRAATLGGARALGLDHEIGSVSVGKLADLLVLDGTLMPTGPEELAGAVVVLGDTSLVDSVMVGGRFVKRDGVLVGHDLRELRRHTTMIRQAPAALPVGAPA